MPEVYEKKNRNQRIDQFGVFVLCCPNGISFIFCVCLYKLMF